jgi:hypothetical protein
MARERLLGMEMFNGRKSVLNFAKVSSAPQFSENVTRT